MEGCIQSAVTTYIIQYMQTNITETAQCKVDEISYGLDTNYLFEILLPWQAYGSWGVLCLLQVELGGGHDFRKLFSGRSVPTN